MFWASTLSTVHPRASSYCVAAAMAVGLTYFDMTLSDPSTQNPGRFSGKILSAKGDSCDAQDVEWPCLVREIRPEMVTMV